MEFAQDVGQRKQRLISHTAIAVPRSSWGYFISAVWEDGAAPPLMEEARRHADYKMAHTLDHLIRFVETGCMGEATNGEQYALDSAGQLPKSWDVLLIKIAEALRRG